MTSERVALVTGGESGIGKAAAVALASDHRAVVVGWHRSWDATESVCKRIRACGALVAPLYFDLSDRDTTVSATRAALDLFGPISTLVNNAAMPYCASIAATDHEALDLVMRVNFQAHVWISQLVVEEMISEGIAGVLINISSIQSTRAKSGSLAYSSAKAALDSFTRVAALELGPNEIRVVSVAPGEILTAMSGLEGVNPDDMDRPVTPLGRPGVPEEVGALIRFLASTDASYITGISIPCDGGLATTMAQS